MSLRNGCTDFQKGVQVVWQVTPLLPVTAYTDLPTPFHSLSSCFRSSESSKDGMQSASTSEADVRRRSYRSQGLTCASGVERIRGCGDAYERLSSDEAVNPFGRSW